MAVPPQVSVILPVFDERENLAPLAREIERAMDGTGASYEVLWIDDASTDGSLEAMRKLAADDPRMRILRHERNAGLSAALDTGFRHARGEVWITMDTDLQHDPADIPMLLDALEAVGCVERRAGRFANSRMISKWMPLLCEGMRLKPGLQRPVIPDCRAVVVAATSRPRRASQSLPAKEPASS